MAVSSFFAPRYLLGAVVVVMLFIGFNMTRPPLETETQSEFQQWYASAAAYLVNDQPTAATPRQIAVTIKIAQDPTSPRPTNEWELLSGVSTEIEKRTRLARVLELIKESGVYGKLSYLSSAAPETPHISIAVVEGEKHFTAYVPLPDLDTNIQLKNLLKLLEVFSQAPPTAAPTINPTQL